MASQRIVPIAVAMVLTVAAGLSITEEHMRSHAAATQGWPSPAPVVPHPSDAAARNNAVLQMNDKPAVTKASTTSATPSPSVGSRALVGD
jgi:hypothetical protein